MDKQSFLDAIFSFFKAADNSKRQDYDIALSSSQQIDWDKLYRIVLQEAESLFLPRPSWIRDRFYRCIKKDNFHYYNNDGTKVIVTLRDGYQYEFELFNCNKSQLEIRRGLKRKFSRRDDRGELVTFVTDIRFIKEDEAETEQAEYSEAV